MLCAVLFVLRWILDEQLAEFEMGQVTHVLVASGHTATNTPDLFRTPKLTVAGPGQYWGGGPPGKPFGCC
jgi:hypothetical protein